MDKNSIEVCLGVGMGQIFPEIIKITIEDEIENSNSEDKKNNPSKINPEDFYMYAESVWIDKTLYQ